MKKNYLIKWWITGLMFLSLPALNIHAQEAQGLPNIIFIMADDMGYGDIQAYDSESKIPTPHLDKFAESGMKFTDAHSAGSSCVTSRYGLLTGRYPFRAASLDWRNQPLIEQERWTIATVLHKNGYRTGMVGKWHLGFDYSDYDNLQGGPVDRGFDYYFGISRSLDQQDYYYIQDKHAVQQPTEYNAGNAGYGPNGYQGPFWRAGMAAPDFKHDEVLSLFTQKSIDFIEGAADNESPFFLYLALASPHTPWLPSERFKGISGAGEYGDWVAENDSSVGSVIRAVYDLGLRENTLIIFTSDNGPVWYPEDIETYGHRATSIYRGKKHDAWEGGHRMPFIASWPGVISQGSQNSQIISQTDMIATFAALVGETLPDSAAEDSHSILPALLDENFDQPLREAFVGTPDNTDDLLIRQADWKLIGTNELYNLADDPSEQTNVYNENMDIATELYALLNKYKDDGRSTPWDVKEHNLAALRKKTLNTVPVYANYIVPELVVKNIGLSKEFNVPVNCKIDSAGTVIYSDTKTIDEIKPFDIRTVSFDSWRTFGKNTYDITFSVQLAADEDTSSDTLHSSIKVTDLLDDFESGFGSWTSDAAWGTDSRRAYNSQFSMAVNPDKRYENNSDSYALYNYAFDLSSIDNPHFTFWSQTIMAGGDTGFVEISTDGGLNWEMIGNAFSGMQSEWVQSQYSLQNYTGSSDVRFRFHFISDDSKTHLGWFIDDVKIEDGLSAISEGKNGYVTNKFELFNNYPNPFNPETVIRYRLSAGSKVSLKIYDILGREIRTLVNERQAAGDHSVTFKSGNLPSGIYIYKIKTGSCEKSRKMCLMR